MSRDRVHSDLADALPRALVESSLERVLTSTAFCRSARHRRLLRYLVDATLDGRGPALSEATLGVAVFDRIAGSYDPRRDPIARIEVGRLRERLARYYVADGAHDAIAFDVPVGGYLVDLRRLDHGPSSARDVESFAVLPFAHGEDEEDRAFALGLADQLTERLGRLRDVRVVGRVSMQRARERHLDLRAMAAALNVTRVVDGSLQRQGERVRCIARVVRARDGVRVWSRTFDSEVDGRGVAEVSDRFAFQDHIVDALVEAAESATRHPMTNDPATNDPATKGATTKGSTTNDSATIDPGASGPVTGLSAWRARYAASGNRRLARELFERASHFARRYDASATEKVIDLLEQSTALDRGNARAEVALARAYLHQTTLNKAAGAPIVPRIAAALGRALSLDPTHSEALGLRAMIAFRFAFDWPEAERLFGEALRLSPHVSDVRYRYAFGLVLNGRFEEGMRQVREAVELDPLNVALRAMAAQLRAFTRDHERAEAELHGVLDLEPAHLYANYVLGQVHLYRRDFDAAIARFEALIVRHPDHPAAYFGRVCGLALRGDRSKSRHALDEFLESRGSDYYPPYGLAVARMCLDERDASYAALARAAVEGDSSFCVAPVDPLFAPAHADAAFVALLAAHGMRSPVP